MSLVNLHQLLDEGALGWIPIFLSFSYRLFKDRMVRVDSCDEGAWSFRLRWDQGSLDLYDQF